jgi:hypothetical protein
VRIQDINWKDRAREFCKEHGSIEVANVEKAMREGATIATQCTTEQLATVRQNLETKRLKANAPQ